MAKPDGVVGVVVWRGRLSQNPAPKPTTPPRHGRDITAQPCAIEALNTA